MLDLRVHVGGMLFLKILICHLVYIKYFSDIAQPFHYTDTRLLISNQDGQKTLLFQNIPLRSIFSYSNHVTFTTFCLVGDLFITRPSQASQYSKRASCTQPPFSSLQRLICKNNQGITQTMFVKASKKKSYVTASDCSIHSNVLVLFCYCN